MYIHYVYIYMYMNDIEIEDVEIALTNQLLQLIINGLTEKKYCICKIPHHDHTLYQ